MEKSKMKTEEELKTRWKSLFVNTMGKDKELFEVLAYGLEQAELKGKQEATKEIIEDEIRFLYIYCKKRKIIADKLINERLEELESKL